MLGIELVARLDGLDEDSGEQANSRAAGTRPAGLPVLVLGSTFIENSDDASRDLC